MSLLHPWYLLGLVAVGLPIVVHYLTRPRPRVLALSTLRFVREVVEQRRARHRLRDVLILLLRAAAVALLAIAFARPLIGAKPLDEAPAGNAVRVVILDSSQSMGAVSGGAQAFERACAAAASRLAAEPGVTANLLLAGATPHAVFPSPSNNYLAIREALAAATPRPEGLNLKVAIDAAADMLAKARAGQRLELIVISDFQRSNWAAADFSTLPKETRIDLESVAPKVTPANLAIVRAGPRGRVEQGREAKLEVEVANYSQTPRDVEVELSVPGGPYRLKGHCPAGLTATLATDAVLTAAGWQTGEARLVAAQDALSADDARSFVLDVRPPLTYLLITRDPAQPHVSSTHFLERALVPRKAAAGASGERVIRVSPDALDRDAVAAADVIAIDHPGRIPAESMKLLASVVRRGRAMLYVAAEPIDASNLGVLAEAAGADLKLPVQFVPAADAAPRRDLFIASTRSSHPVLSVFGEGLASAPAPLRFNGGLDAHAVQGGLTDDLVATYSDRSAALVFTACGAGKLAVLNADLSRSNLPSSPIFVPLIGELVGRLVARTGGGDAQPCGELAVSFLPPDVTSADGLTIDGPAGSEVGKGALSTDAGLVAWKMEQAGPPGVYQVKRGGVTLFALATAAPAAESDLTPIDPSILTTRLAGGRTVHFSTAGADEAPPETGWAWVITACVICMLLEVVALRFFRT